MNKKDGDADFAVLPFFVHRIPIAFMMLEICINPLALIEQTKKTSVFFYL